MLHVHTRNLSYAVMMLSLSVFTYQCCHCILAHEHAQPYWVLAIWRQLLVWNICNQYHSRQPCLYVLHLFLSLGLVSAGWISGSTGTRIVRVWIRLLTQWWYCHHNMHAQGKESPGTEIGNMEKDCGPSEHSSLLRTQPSYLGTLHQFPSVEGPSRNSATLCTGFPA